MRRAMTLSILALCMALCASCANALLAASANGREERTFTLDAGGKVSLENINGDVTVRPSQGSQVRIVAVKKARALDEAKAKEALSQLKVEMASGPKEITVTTIYPNAKGRLFGAGSWLSVDYTLEVPQGTVLDLSGVNGCIDVAVPGSDVTGEVTNGSIKVQEAGKLSATTVNGKIGFSAQSLGEVSSTNGAIEGSLLSQKPSAGKVETVNGSVTLSIATGAALRVEAENVNGSINGSLPGLSGDKHSLSGDLNGGGATLSIETVNGSIEIK